MKILALSRIKKIILWTLCLGVILFFSIVGFIYSQYEKTFIDHSDCGVIFGAAVWRGDTPSHALYDRTMAGINLVKNNQLQCLVLSGGPSTYGSHEIDVMKKIISESNIPDIEIIMDYNGINTLKTIQNLSPNRSYVLISNDFHLARIYLLAWREGLNEFSVHAALYNQGRYRKESYYIVREVAGIIYYGLRLD